MNTNEKAAPENVKFSAISVFDFLKGLPHSKQPLDFARYYASKGLAVFPIYEPLGDGRCACGDSACADVGKHPRITGGVYSATLDEDEIRRWWMTWPNANVAIATGSVSGVVVVDVDPHRNGVEALNILQEAIGSIPDDAVVLTGGDGLHLYLGNPDEPVRNRTNFRDGLDFRADSGYVVAPPSLHASGIRYEWVRP